MNNPTLWCWVAAAALLNACSSGEVPRGQAAPPPDLSIFDSASPGVAPQGPDSIGASRGTSGGGTKLVAGWSKPGVTRTRQLADTESCYHFAWAQVDNDIRIDDDIAAARTQLGSEFTRLSSVTRQADAYYYRNQRIARLESCLRAKGYSPE